MQNKAEEDISMTKYVLQIIVILIIEKLQKFDLGIERD